ncbi:hypothetical protein BDW71DRAFT_171841 [Aspergillus fruticulosus]
MRYRGIAHAPAITQLHYKSDLVAAISAAVSMSGESGDTGSESNGDESETPSNAAERLGLGPVVGIWVVAAMLGPALALPWQMFDR